MTAQEMRNTAENTILRSDSFQKVQGYIEQAAKEGKFSTTAHESELNEADIELLRKKGFTVETNHYIETYIISW